MPPVAADGAGRFRGVLGQAAEVVATFAGGRAAGLAGGFDEGDAAERGPLGLVGEPVEYVGAEVAARFDPAVIFFQPLMPTGGGKIPCMIEGVVEEGFDLLVEDFVVGFEREHVAGVDRKSNV